MIAGLARRHRGRSHATQTAASTDKATHYPRRFWGAGGGRRGKIVVCYLYLQLR